MRATNAREADEIAARITAQSWLDAGYTQAELDQSAQVADLLDRLVASGRSMDTVLDEWEGKSAEAILATCYEDECPDRSLPACALNVKGVRG